jgi:hypothetical protein
MPPAPQPKFKLTCSLPQLTSDPIAIDKVCGARGNSQAGSNSANQNMMTLMLSRRQRKTTIFRSAEKKLLRTARQRQSRTCRLIGPDLSI